MTICIIVIISCVIDIAVTNLTSVQNTLGKLGQQSGQVFGDSKSKKATTNCVGSLTCTVTDNTIIDVAMIINIILMNKVFAKLKCLLAIHAEGMQRVDLHDHKNQCRYDHQRQFHEDVFAK